MATKQKTYNVGGVQLDRPFKIRRLGHFGFNVVDMDAGVHFYRNLLGFKMSDMINFAANPERAKLLKEKGIEDARGRFFHYGGDHHAFVLFPKAALDATQTGYEVGTRNVVDVLDAQRNLFRTVRDYNTVRYNYIINNLNLKLAAGTLSPQDLQDLSQWLNPNYDPDEDFIPQATQEEMEQMSMGNRPTPLPPSDPDSTTF